MSTARGKSMQSAAATCSKCLVESIGGNTKVVRSASDATRGDEPRSTQHSCGEEGNRLEECELEKQNDCEDADGCDYCGSAEIMDEDVDICQRNEADEESKFDNMEEEQDNATISSMVETQDDHSRVYVVLMRVLDQCSPPSAPQAAFYSQQKALAYGLHVFNEFCKHHFNDYIYYGPKQIETHPTFRFTARHPQTMKSIVVVDVVRVSIFDGPEGLSCCSDSGSESDTAVCKSAGGTENGEERCESGSVQTNEDSLETDICAE